MLPQCDVLHDRKIRGEIQLLIDHGDPGHAGVMWVFRMEGGTFQENASSVRCMHPTEDLHERALARTVLSNQGVNFAGPDLKTHAPQGVRGTKAFANPLHGKAHRRCLTHGGGGQLRGLHGFLR